MNKREIWVVENCDSNGRWRVSVGGTFRTKYEAREMAARQCERVTTGERSEYDRGYFAALSHVEKDIRAMKPRDGGEA